MKRSFLIFLAAALVSCHKEPAQQPGPEPDPGPDPTPQEYLREIAIEAGIISKTTLDGDKLMWEGGDEIAIVFHHSTEGPYVNRAFSNVEKEQSSEIAVFKGLVSSNISEENGYCELGYAVYPKTAVTEDGGYAHSLPVEQFATANGSYTSELNLMSASVSLSEMDEDTPVKADFNPALSTLQFELSSDVESITLTGTTPLAGAAPLKMGDDDRLEADVNGSWTDASNSVTLKPAAGFDTFEKGVYSMLVWPGNHEELTVTVAFRNLGEYVEALTVSSESSVALKPGKYYELAFKNKESLFITELAGKLDNIEGDIPSLDEVEGNISILLSQIQSVSLMTEYLNNAVYAHYTASANSFQRQDLSLDYVVRPESAAHALVDVFNADHSVVTALLGTTGPTGFDVIAESAVKNLIISELSGFGEIVTAVIDPSDISREFYEGKQSVSVALQIADGNTSLLSDFANLVPKAASTITGSYVKNIPVVPGAKVEIPFNYTVADPDATYSLVISEYKNVDGASLTYRDDFKSGYLTVYVNGTDPMTSQNVTVTMTVGEGENSEMVSQQFTFVDSGSRIDFVDPGKVDYIGGDIVLDVTTQDISSYMLSCSGSGVSQSGNIFTFGENMGGERSVIVDCQATIPSVSLNFYKSITLTQKAYGTPLSKVYYTDGQKVVLNQADSPGCSDYFNIVILGDGYKKKDLAVGGKFERSARSAMDTFFAIEPYKTFKNRFNVYMASYESAEEGTDVRSAGIVKDTYFDTYCQGGGNTASYVSDATPVINAVKAVVGNGDAQYYRTIAIVLVNTDEQAGSTGYPFRGYKSGFVNGYASFAIAVLAANSTGTNGLVKHEAGGHAFGRLADEYYNSGSTATSSNKTDLSNWHAKGWYWNVNPSDSGNYYMFTNSAYSSSEVSFIEGGWGYGYGMYRSTQGGMMQSNTGVFNAPCRHAIYHRIITESEGASAYSWSKFLEYDQMNR